MIEVDAISISKQYQKIVVVGNRSSEILYYCTNVGSFFPEVLYFGLYHPKVNALLILGTHHTWDMWLRDDSGNLGFKP